MEVKKFEFGKNYIVLDYKVKKLQRESATRAEFSLDPEAFVVTLSLFNSDDLKINETSFDLPLEALITSVDLDYENKKLVFNTADGGTIDCDITEIVDKLENAVYKDDNDLVPLYNLPKEYNTDFTITPSRSASQVFESFGSNKLNLQSSVLKTIAPGPAYFNNSSNALTNGQQGFAFSVDGTKMFTVDTSSDLLYQYTLGTAWDINTLVIPATLSVDIKTVDNTINGVYFKPDGTKIFMIGSTKGVFSATLSTPWDISTLNEFSTTTGLIANKAYTSLMLSTDGLKLYVGNSTDDTIDIYYLNTAWDTGSILDDIISSIDVSAQEGTITGFFIGNDGETLFIVGSASDKVYQYIMSAPWGDTAVYADKFIETQQGTTTDVQFKPDGSRMFLIGTTTRRVDEYIVPSNWDLYGGQVVTKEIKDSFYLRTVIDTDNESSNLEVGTILDELDISVPLLTIDKNGNIKSKATNVDFTAGADVSMSANGAYFNLGTDGDTTINAGNAGISLTAGTGIDINSKLKIKAGVADNLDSEGLDGQALTKQNDNVVWSDSFVKTTWQELKDKRDAGLLTAGAQYRITDYITTTAQENTQSAGHQFDIIVMADDEKTLNENARAILHNGDTYFANAKLLAWELKYSITNDTTRFAWADSVNGKGVIYRMIDEWNNECPYDFKNIQFIRKITDGVLDLVDGVDTWVYTFNAYNIYNDNILDGSLLNGYPIDDADIICKNNMVKSCNQESMYGMGIRKQELNDIVFLNMYSLDDGIYFECYNNSFGNSCYGNTFGNECSDNTFGNDCSSNTFGDICGSNTFGSCCSSNTFGNDCNANAFGNICGSNTFGSCCSSNTFGTNCNANAFGNICSRNTLGSCCGSNTFGSGCSSNTFGSSCNYLKISENAGAKTTYLSIGSGLNGASSVNRLELYDSAIANKTYQITFKKASSGRYLMLWATDTGAMTGKYKALNTDETWTAL